MEDFTVETTSTAPTTPDGSLTFSPVIRPAQLLDAFDTTSETTSSKERSYSTVSQGHGGPQMVVKNICCVGAGYVGGPTSAVIAFQNPSIRVNVVDRDPRRIASWNSKHLPIHENGLSEVVRIARDGSKACTIRSGKRASLESENEEARDEIQIAAREPNLFFSTEVAKCVAEADIILITVNTPTKMRGMGAGRATDVTALEGATREIALHARADAILVEKSTVPCGTAQLIQETLQTHRPGVNFEILSNPEFLAEGTAVKDLLSPDRVIIGSSDSPSGRLAAATLAEVYAAWVPRSRITTINVFSSELSKLVANAMLAQRISSINSVSAICERTGANIDEIALSIGLDPRIGPQFLKSGLGFGGSCFKKDILSLTYLAETLGLPEVSEYWQQVLTMNDFQRNRFATRVIKRLNNTLIRKKITLLGYAFKKNTSDTRESPAIEVIKTLLNDCPSEIAIFDPCCNPDTVRAEINQMSGKGEPVLKADGGPVEVYADVYEACRDSNAVVILTEWDEFRNTPAPIAKSQRPDPKAPAAQRTANSKVPTDPRPFASSPPSESEILALHRYLSQDSATTNPLARYHDEPICAADCPSCTSETGKYSKTGEQLDWERVLGGLRSPKWVFDGRGILDVGALEALGGGVRVEGVGYVGR